MTEAGESADVPQRPDGPVPGVIASISFDGIECPVRRTQVHETYFAFDPPNGAPSLYTDGIATNDQLIAFVNQWLPSAREVMADVAKRFRKSDSLICHYQTGDLAYVFGRPFMLRVYQQARGNMRHAARGRTRANVRVIPEVSLIEVFVVQVGDHEQRRLSFMSWADGVLTRNGAALFAQAAERAGVSLPRKQLTFRARDVHDCLVRYDEKMGVVWFSRDLIPFPPHCCAYACARELAQHVVSKELPLEEREAALAKVVQAGCPDWEHARQLLTDKNSVFRRQ